MEFPTYRELQHKVWKNQQRQERRWWWNFNVKFPLQRRWDALRATLERGHRRRPKVGEWIYPCFDAYDENGELRRKQVAYVSMREDIIEYVDGASDSYFCCGWGHDADKLFAEVDNES